MHESHSGYFASFMLVSWALGVPLYPRHQRIEHLFVRRPRGTHSGAQTSHIRTTVIPNHSSQCEQTAPGAATKRAGRQRAIDARRRPSRHSGAAGAFAFAHPFLVTPGAFQMRAVAVCRLSRTLNAPASVRRLVRWKSTLRGWRGLGRRRRRFLK